MTKEQAQWLIDEFKPIRRGTVNGKTIGVFIKAINIILNQSRRIPSCGCEFGVTATIANSAFDQHEQKILKLYNS